MRAGLKGMTTAKERDVEWVAASSREVRSKNKGPCARRIAANAAERGANADMAPVWRVQFHTNM